jgi:hypothetical protein
MRRIIDEASNKNDRGTFCRVNSRTFCCETARMCIEAVGGHSEHLLQQ